MSGYGTHNMDNEALRVLVRKPSQLLILAGVVRKLLDQCLAAEEKPVDSNQAS